MNKLIVLFFCLLLAMPCAYSAVKVNQATHYPHRKLALQFNGSTRVFTTADPTPAGSGLTRTSATGVAPDDGVVTLAFLGGFTPTITLTVYYWQVDSVTASNSCWVRLGNISTNYATTVDTNYAMLPFYVPAGAAFLVQSSAAVTGSVFTNASSHADNNNSASGYQP